MKYQIEFSLAILFLFLFVVITPVTAYSLIINCPEEIQIGHDLNCSVSSDYQTGLIYEIVFCKQQQQITQEISRQIVINLHNKSQYRLFSTDGLSKGNYSVFAQRFDIPLGFLSSESNTAQQVILVPEYDQNHEASTSFQTRQTLISSMTATTPAQFDIHEGFFSWYWCRYEPVVVKIPENNKILRQTMKVCYQFFWNGNYAVGNSAGLHLARLSNDTWKNYADSQYRIRCQTFTYYGDRLETTLNPSFGPFIRDKTGLTDQQWGTHGMKAGQFYNPGGIAIDEIGDVYVADTNNHRIQKFTPNGGFISTWGSWGSGQGEFIFPEGITVDHEGIVYVLDINRVQKFSHEGSYLGQWNINWSVPEDIINLNGDYYRTGDSNRKSIAVDKERNIFVAGDNRIQKFSSNGHMINQWGSKGSANGQFILPWSIAVDSKGNIYVTDLGNNRVQKFNSEGKYLTQWGSEGSGNGQFNCPVGIAIDTYDNVFVTDLNNRRIQTFSPEGIFLTQSGWMPEWTGYKERFLPTILSVNSNSVFYLVDGDRIRTFFPDISQCTIAQWDGSQVIQTNQQEIAITPIEGPLKEEKNSMDTQNQIIAEPTKADDPSEAANPAFILGFTLQTPSNQNNNNEVPLLNLSWIERSLRYWITPV